MTPLTISRDYYTRGSIISLCKKQAAQQKRAGIVLLEIVFLGDFQTWRRFHSKHLTCRKSPKEPQER